MTHYQNFHFFSGLACGCDPQGFISCDPNSGTCSCKEGYTGPKCKECSDGYFGFPNCQSILDLKLKSGKVKSKLSWFPGCDYCDESLTKEKICDSETGKCLCRKGFSGDLCDKCDDNHFTHPFCTCKYFKKKIHSKIFSTLGFFSLRLPWWGNNKLW